VKAGCWRALSKQFLHVDSGRLGKKKGHAPALIRFVCKLLSGQRLNGNAFWKYLGPLQKRLRKMDQNEAKRDHHPSPKATNAFEQN